MGGFKSNIFVCLHYKNNTFHPIFYYLWWIFRVKESIKKLKEELLTKQTILIKINELENCKIDNYTDFKYIKPNEVSSSSFSKCALIEKESETTFFPTILHFKSKMEFEQISKNQKYRLIVNPTEKVKKTNEEIGNSLKTCGIFIFRQIIFVI